MLKRLFLLAMLMVQAGCASTYTPSGRMLQLKQGMDKQSALAIFTKYMKPSKGNGGYCGGNLIRFDKGTPITITSAGYSFQAFKSGDLISSERTGNTITNKYKKVYYQAIGLSDQDVEQIIRLTCTHSQIPEALRVAHLIASGIRGESRGRA